MLLKKDNYTYDLFNKKYVKARCYISNILELNLNKNDLLYNIKMNITRNMSYLIKDKINLAKKPVNNFESEYSAKLFIFTEEELRSILWEYEQIIKEEMGGN